MNIADVSSQLATLAPSTRLLWCLRYHFRIGKRDVVSRGEHEVRLLLHASTVSVNATTILRKPPRLLIFAVALVGVSISDASGEVVLEHPRTVGSTNSWGSFESQDALRSFSVYDNFVLASPTRIEGLTWEGVYRDSVTPANNPVDGPTATSWTLAIYGDSNDEPGGLIDSRTVSAANVTNSFVAFRNIVGDTVPLYSSEVTLDVPFAVAGNQPYWLSVVASTPTISDSWGWTSGTGGDDRTIQDNKIAGFRNERLRDRTFSLIGTVIPEPASAFFLTGLGTAFAMRRRRCVV